jgi:predicted aspartyl protease
MWQSFALTALLLAPSPVIADEERPAAAQQPAAAPGDTLGIGTDSPGRMTVPVTIGATGPYAFTIDTGAERTVISRELATSLGLQPGRVVRMTAMTGQSNVGTVIIPSLSVSRAGGTRIEAPTLYAQNLGAPGLLGIDTLKDHAVNIDFDNNVMSVRPSQKRGSHYKAEPGEIVVHAKSLFGQLVVTDAEYQGQRVRVILDTGSVVSMGNGALRRRVRSLPTPQKIALLSVTGASLSADYTHINNVRLGEVVFGTLAIAFADAAPFRQLGLEHTPALLLGMDALKQFRRVDIDFANREVRLALPRGLTRPTIDCFQLC